MPMAYQKYKIIHHYPCTHSTMTRVPFFSFHLHLFEINGAHKKNTFALHKIISVSTKFVS